MKISMQELLGRAKRFGGTRREDKCTFSFDYTKSLRNFDKFQKIFHVKKKPLDRALSSLLSPFNGLTMNHIEASRNAQDVTALLRFQSVQARTGLARSTLYKLIALQDFPPPITLTGRAVAWDSRAVDSWIQSRIATAAHLPSSP